MPTTKEAAGGESSSSLSSFASWESHTAHSWKSEGPYYLPNPSLRGTVERKAPSKRVGRREGAYVFAGPLQILPYLHPKPIP